MFKYFTAGSHSLTCEKPGQVYNERQHRCAGQVCDRALGTVNGKNSRCYNFTTEQFVALPLSELQGN